MQASKVGSQWSFLVLIIISRNCDAIFSNMPTPLMKPLQESDENLYKWSHMLFFHEQAMRWGDADKLAFPIYLFCILLYRIQGQGADPKCREGLGSYVRWIWNHHKPNGRTDQTLG